MHYLLTYDITPDFLPRRVGFRATHLALAWQATDRGELVLGGAVGDPVESALLLFRCDSPDVPAAFAKADPYVLNGLVTRWRVLPWDTVAGHEAVHPVRAGCPVRQGNRPSPSLPASAVSQEGIAEGVK